MPHVDFSVITTFPNGAVVLERRQFRLHGASPHTTVYSDVTCVLLRVPTATQAMTKRTASVARA